MDDISDLIKLHFTNHDEPTTPTLMEPFVMEISTPTI